MDLKCKKEKDKKVWQTIREVCFHDSFSENTSDISTKCHCDFICFQEVTWDVILVISCPVRITLICFPE